MERISNTEIQRWLNDRHASIGGSEAAAIAGQSNWDSPLSVYLKKSGLVEPEAATTRLKVGLLAEPMIRALTLDYFETQEPGRYELVSDAELMQQMLKAFHRESGLKLQISVYGKGDASILMVRHPKYPRCHATPDGLLHDKKTGGLFVWEAKTSSEFMRSEWYSGVPHYYQVQARHNAAIMALPGTYLSALIGFGDDQYHFIEPAEDGEANLEFLSAWYESHIIEGNEPEASAQDTAIIRKLTPDAGGPALRALEMPEALMLELCELDREYQEVIDAKKGIGDEYDRMRNRVRQIMGESDELWLPSGACWTNRKGKKGRTLNRKKSEAE